MMALTSERMGEEQLFRFTGVMDENLSFPVLEEPKPARVTIELEGVTMINSLACRNWVSWVKALPPITLKNCPPAIVNQANILVGFIPKHAEIASFFVPYFCDPCGVEERTLLERGKDFEMGGKVEPKASVPCPTCGEPMELDVMPDRYFRFLVVK